MKALPTKALAKISTIPKDRYPAVRVSGTDFLKRKRRKRRKKKPTNSKRWYRPSVSAGWAKTSSLKARRQGSLSAHKGDSLATARALQALANVTQDRETKTEARKDALYFFAKHREEK